PQRSIQRHEPFGGGPTSASPSLTTAGPSGPTVSTRKLIVAPLARSLLALGLGVGPAQLVAHVAHRLDEPAGHRAELGAHPPDVDVDRARTAVVPVTPHLLQ